MLDQEIASLESNPEEAQRQQALDEIRQDSQYYDKVLHELQHMHMGTNPHLMNLLRSSKDQAKNTTKESKGDSKSPSISNKLETLLEKTTADYV